MDLCYSLSIGPFLFVKDIVKPKKSFEYNIISPRDEQRRAYYGLGLIIKVHNDVITILWTKDNKIRSYDKTYLRNVILVSEIFK